VKKLAKLLFLVQKLKIIYLVYDPLARRCSNCHQTEDDRNRHDVDFAVVALILNIMDHGVERIRVRVLKTMKMLRSILLFTSSQAESNYFALKFETKFPREK